MPNKTLASDLKFTRDDIGSSVTKLHKTGPILRNKKLKYLPRVVDTVKSKFSGRFLYDITYDGDTSFKTLTGTELLSSAIFVHPCNYVVRDRQIQEASLEDSSEDVVARILYQDDNMDKYRLVRQPFFREIDAVVFLAGSNIFEDATDFSVVAEAVKNGAVVKPHPVTNHDVLERQRRMWGSANVLSHKISGFDILKKSAEVYSGGNSEMGIYAAMLRKKTHSCESANFKKNPAYRPLFNLILSSENPYQALNNVFSSSKSGIFFTWDNVSKISEYLKFAEKEIGYECKS